MTKMQRTLTVGGFLVLLLFVSSALAQESPTITIQNQSSEPVLAKVAGPTAGFISIPAGGARTVQVLGGRYLALFRYGEKHYIYTKVGPFDVVQTATGVSKITIVLHTSAGNTTEDPSNEREFNGQ